MLKNALSENRGKIVQYSLILSISKKDLFVNLSAEKARMKLL